MLSCSDLKGMLGINLIKAVYCRYITLFFKTTHISVLPVELLNYILRWVVSVDLDMKSLENFSEVKVVFNNYHPVEISNMS